MQPAEIRAGVLLLAAQFPGQRHGDVLSAAVRAAVAAEQAGFDDVWFAEHHFMSYGVCPSAATLAAYVLGRTSRIAVGTAVSVLSTQHPVALAEQAALLDQVSGGRFWLGVGRGGPWVDLEVFGTGLARYETGFAEGLDLLLAALTQGSVRGTGPAFTFDEVAMVPQPRTRPHPPLVVACTSRQTAALAAGRGLPMLLGLHTGDDGKAEMIGAYQAAARPASRSPAISAPSSPRWPIPASRPSGCCAASCRAGWAPAWPGTGRWTAVPAPPAIRVPTPSCCARSTRSAPPMTAWNR
jgi:alkanesulfonate monooxygenase SsuD/methylene tetrahydromethanopterin reductase-like flavin-dependent oxidoreductase (luciferase family)